MKTAQNPAPNQAGFTLLELMFVIAIIGILAAISIPNYMAFKNKSYRVEPLNIMAPIRQDIVEFYDHTGTLPPDNKSCGQPEPKHIKGQFIDSVTITDGIITFKYNQDYNGMSYPEKKACENQYQQFIPTPASPGQTGVLLWEEKPCTESI